MFARFAPGCLLCGILAFSLMGCSPIIEESDIPSWAIFEDEDVAADLDGDGDLEAIVLQDQLLSVYDGDPDFPAVSLPHEWHVSQVCVTDVDLDGVQDLMCLTWKRGSYGIYKPFWIEEDDPGFSQHVFIFEYEEGKGRGAPHRLDGSPTAPTPEFGSFDYLMPTGRLIPKWMSSDVGIEIAEMSVDALGQIDLVLADGSDLELEWQGFGLKYVDEVTPSWREAEYDSASIIAVGDNIAQNSMVRAAVSGSDDEGGDAFDFHSIYEDQRLGELIADADMAAITQETPLTRTDDEVSAFFPLYITPYEMADGLVDAGFDVVLHATNHIGDGGVDGIAETLDIWSEHDEVEMLGIGDAVDGVIVDAEGIPIAMIDATDILNDGTPDSEKIPACVSLVGDGDGLCVRVEELDAEADATIVFLHIGEEYSTVPSTTIEKLAERLIDSGADIVICSHPHVVQRAQEVVTENGNVGLIYYSLGNFAANQPYPQTVLGAIAKLDVIAPKGDDASLSRIQEPSILTWQLIPTVCHVSDGETRIMLLADYDEDLAANHDLNIIEPGAISSDSLRHQWLETVLDNQVT